jgi:DNA-binding sugar fermentation-stimulating protein
MPSGQLLAPDAAALHERAARHLEALVRQAATGSQPRP